MLSEPTLTSRTEDGHDLPLLHWRATRPLRAVSSGPLGGGIGLRNWVVNATVPMSYRRDDPADHLADLAVRLGLDGPGVGLLTGVDVTELVTAADGGVRVWATVGLGIPVDAAAPAPSLDAAVPAQRDAAAPVPVESAARSGGGTPGHRVGTVNIVVLVPVRLADAALVNAVATATEAKTQAIRDLGRPGTGTPTDAVTVLCPPDGPAEPYGGPRSRWGGRLARAVYAAVRAGADGQDVAWSDRYGH
ncbi:adenosylcobinamide amidohydrolase [Micromonospora cathayae]|uniref:Adenosylcobinamide amidohydrolase n=1 Tax=Micromonospora cathayae TaxID=3028804 RepID=A0ABY7ZRS1_9ACTN|nr:adenosylcobinamide amidohydrolase [Micromonospora sp. HUAS 3]WDZ85731.1 adenosylcobinamide amidohydrolase [Micromonospora sp. HUAS 3]